MYKAKSISYESRVRLFWALVVAMVVSFGLYISAVNTTMRNTALRQTLEAEVSHLSAEIGSLEFAYIEKRNEISMEVARDYGFREAKNPLYVSRNPGQALTYNTSRN